MGQTLGKAQIELDAFPFINLPASLVLDLRQAVYEVAEGYGLTLIEVKEIVCISLREYLHIPESKIDEYTQALFDLFNANGPLDTKESLIDSFEFLATICIVSGMRLDEKINFIFDLFDFSDAGQLTANELTLAFRASAAGAMKLSLSPTSIEADKIDQIAVEAFEISGTSKSTEFSTVTQHENTTLSKENFFQFAINCRETWNLLDHYDDIVNGVVARKGQSLTEFTPLRFCTSDVGPKLKDLDGPWRDQIRFLKPNQDETSVQKPPSRGLSLGWVYGRNTGGSQALYGEGGEIFYPAGSMILKLYTSSDGKIVQEFFSEHFGHVTSIDIFRFDDHTGEAIASADSGKDAKICVWSTQNMRSSVSFKPFHQHGVSKLCFSPSGSLLLTIGKNDVLYSIGVYDWRKRTLAFTSRLIGTDLYDCSFLESDDSFSVCSDEVFFWTHLSSDSSYKLNRGVFNRLSSTEVMTCIACTGSVVVTGSISGRIWVWEGRVCSKLLEAFNSGPITRLHARRESNDDVPNLCASTHDGVIYLFNRKLELQSRFCLHSRPSEKDRMIDSIFLDKSGKILMGQNSNLYTMTYCDEQSLTCVMHGHLDVTGFAVNPLENEQVISAGKNGTLKLWDAITHSVLRESHIDAALSCVAFKPSGDQIAIGLATTESRPNLAKNSYMVISSSDLNKVVHSGCNSHQTLTVCKYSNDGKILAFGSYDSSIYIHLCTEKGFPLIAKARGHSSPIMNIDFGSEPNPTTTAFLRSNSESGEAMFWTLKGKRQTPLSQRDTKWESQTCTFSWCMEAAHDSVKGIGRGASITSCCQYCPENKPLIVTGSSCGRLQVFVHPAISKHPFYLEYKGHSGNVSDIQVSCNNTIVHSICHEDSCIFQWKTLHLDWGEDNESSTLDYSKFESITGRKSHEVREVLPESVPEDTQTMINQLSSLDFDLFDTTANVVKPKPKSRPKPWKRQIAPPSDYLPTEGHHPDSTMSMERVQGYSGNKTRNNLHYLDDNGECMLYTVGKILVQFDAKEDIQNFYSEASGNLTSLAVNKAQSICAISHSNFIIVVDLRSMTTLSILRDHDAEIISLDFDDAGKFLVSVADDGCHDRIIVHDWKSGNVIASSQTFGTNTVEVKFSHDSSRRIIQCGAKCIRLWKIEGCTLVFDVLATAGSKKDSRDFFCCVANCKSIVAGTSSGKLVYYDNSQTIDKPKAHSSAIVSISSGKDVVATGSTDGFVKVWNASMKCMLSINLQALRISGQISSIHLSENQEKILLGSRNNELWELSCSDGSILSENGGPITCFHSSYSSGLSMSPNGCNFATTGDDGFLRLWNVFDHSEMKSFEMGMPSRSCAFSPDGNMIAIGFGKPVKENAKVMNGKWSIVNVDTLTIIAERRDTRTCIVEMKWHSRGERIAVGSNDNICVYQIFTKTKPATNVEISLLTIIEQLCSPAIHFDFSRDGKYLQVNSQSHELLFFEAGPGIRIKEASRMKDIIWDTNTSTCTWSVQGVWGDDAEVTTLDCSIGNKIVVAGTCDGQLRVYQHPCISHSSQFSVHKPSNGAILKARFVPGASHIVTLQHNAVIIWRNEERNEDESNVITLYQSSFPDSDNAVEDGDENDVISTLMHHGQHRSTLTDDVDVPKTFLLETMKMIAAFGTLGRCNSCHYDASGEIVYPISSTCVLYSSNLNQQSLFQKHNSQVSVIGISNSRRFVLSGEVGSPRILVWDSQTGVNIALLSNSNAVGVSQATFSPDDRSIACICADGYNRIFIWKTLNGFWNDAFLCSEALAGVERVYFACFADFTSQENSLITGGKNHVHFWEEKDGALVLSKGILPEKSANATFLCGVNVDGKLVTGTACGSLVLFEKHEAMKAIKAHNDSVLALKHCPEGLVSGGIDGYVTVWSMSFQKMSSFQVSSSLSRLSRAVCSLDIQIDTRGKSTKNILAGTGCGYICEISKVTGRIYPLIDNHDGKVNAVVFNPISNEVEYATVGDDMTIRVWNAKLNRTIRLSTPGMLPLTAVDWSSDGKELLIGCGEVDGMRSEGKLDYCFMILKSDDLSMVYTGKDSNHGISAVKYSPDNKSFACAYVNYKICIHDNSLDTKYKLISIANKHSAVITAIDFTVDSQWFQSMSFNNDKEEVICFATESGEPLTSSSKLKMLEWATNTCICVPSNNVGMKVEDPSRIVPWCSQLSKDQSLLVVCNDSGHIELYKCFDERIDKRMFRAHCGTISQCVLSNDGQTLITVGKMDLSLLVWDLRQTVPEFYMVAK